MKRTSDSARPATVALRLARGDALLFLNPDCLIEADTIAGLRDDAQRHSDAGVLGVRVLDAGGKVEAGQSSTRSDPARAR